MEIKFDVQMDEKTMYNFLLFHSYSNVVVLIGNVFGILLAVMGATALTTDTGKAALYLIFGVGMVVYTPFSLKLSAKRQMMSEVFSKPITYTITEQGLTSSQNDMTTEATWEDMMKVVSTSKSIVLYTGKNKATILPKNAMKENYEAVVKMISTHLPPQKVKIKQ